MKTQINELLGRYRAYFQLSYQDRWMLAAKDAEIKGNKVLLAYLLIQKRDHDIRSRGLL